jgi:hypothetical protein
MRREAREQSRSRAVRIARQQQHGLCSRLGVDIRAIDTGIRHDETEPVLDYQNARPPAHNASRLSQNDLDEPRVLLHFCGKALGAGRWHHRREVDVARLGL